jgi:hypothetical protein
VELRVRSRYRSGEVEYAEGTVIHVSEEMGAFLLRDSPGSFEEVRAADEPGVETAETATGMDVPDRRARGGLRR